jgi:hypothetical protein
MKQQSRAEHKGHAGAAQDRAAQGGGTVHKHVRERSRRAVHVLTFELVALVLQRQ